MHLDSPAIILDSGFYLIVVYQMLETILADMPSNQIHQMRGQRLVGSFVCYSVPQLVE